MGKAADPNRADSDADVPVPIPVVPVAYPPPCSAYLPVDYAVPGAPH
jgi:hypothetical protein